MTLTKIIKKTALTLGLLLTLNQTVYAELEKNPVENNQNIIYRFESIDAKEALIGLEKLFLGLYEIENINNNNTQIKPEINYFELNATQISEYKFPIKLLQIVDSTLTPTPDNTITLEEIGETYKKYEENISKQYF